LIESDINIKPFLPTRLERINGAKLPRVSSNSIAGSKVTASILQAGIE
jgi:hypothetical protein